MPRGNDDKPMRVVKRLGNWGLMPLAADFIGAMTRQHVPGLIAGGYQRPLISR